MFIKASQSQCLLFPPKEDVGASGWMAFMQLGLYSKLDTTDYQHFVPYYNERRFSHTWVLGKSGFGKSTALIRWAVDDLIKGDGLAFFDPHGDAVDTILLHVPPERRHDVVLIDIADRNYPVGFNVLHNVAEQDRAFVASSIVDTFKSLWGDSWGPQLEQFLYNGIAALLEVPDGTLVGLKYLLTSPTYRKEVLSFVSDPVIRDFWQTDFEELMPVREQRQRTLSTLNKIGALVADSRIRNVIGQPVSTIDFRALMDNRKILLISLPQGKLGIQKSALIGALLMSQLHLSALGRCSVNPFHIYADEAHHFGTNTLEEMLSGIRKRHVSMVIAHQYVDQLSPSLKAALIGTVATIVGFRMGATDAAILKDEFMHASNDLTLVGLNPYMACVRSGSASDIITMPEIQSPKFEESTALIRKFTRQQYANQRSQVEKRIKRFIANT